MRRKVQPVLAPANLKTFTTVVLCARAAILSMLVALLSSCSPASNSMLQTLRQAAWRGDSIASARLNPNFRYLRVTIAGRVVLLALGNEDVDALGLVEVWYSAEREVLRLQNGRLVGATGLTTEWRSVLMPELPSWSMLARGEKVYQWTRVRDVMPGYRFGVRDGMSVRVISAPRKSELQKVDAQGLTWFEERVDSIGGGEVLPRALYAVDMRDGKEVVVYGEQCLDKDLCFSWQRWPVQGPPRQNSCRLDRI